MKIQMGRPSTDLNAYIEESEAKIQIWMQERKQLPKGDNQGKKRLRNKISALRSRIKDKTLKESSSCCKEPLNGQPKVIKELAKKLANAKCESPEKLREYILTKLEGRKHHALPEKAFCHN